MSHFAEIDENNIVIRVIVAEEDFINSGAVGDPSRWIQTSYNTHSGVHVLNGTPLRKNFAGVGYKYDSTRDAFIPPQRFKSWSLNEDTCLWDPPIARPTDGKPYYWDENQQLWIETVVPEEPVQETNENGAA